MAFKGTASKSASGASMSKYDVEVEKRLKALEAVAHPVPAAGEGGGVDAKVEYIVAAAQRAKATDVGVEGKLEILLSALAAL